jgi:hypothetical protein
VAIHSNPEVLLVDEVAIARRRLLPGEVSQQQCTSFNEWCCDCRGFTRHQIDRGVLPTGNMTRARHRDRRWTRARDIARVCSYSARSPRRHRGVMSTLRSATPENSICNPLRNRTALVCSL